MSTGMRVSTGPWGRYLDAAVAPVGHNDVAIGVHSHPGGSVELSIALPVRAELEQELAVCAVNLGGGHCPAPAPHMGHGTWDMALAPAHGTWDAGCATQDTGHSTWDTGHGTWDMAHSAEDTSHAMWHTGHGLQNMACGTWHARHGT